MLSVHTQQTFRDTYAAPFRHLEVSSPVSNTTLFYSQGGMGGGYPPKGSSTGGHQAPIPAPTAEEIAVAQALEIARESYDGAQDPTVNSILDAALTKIWAKVQSQPDSYTMSRNEFAVFNFFQYKFQGNKVAIAARKRYWDNTSA